MKHALAVWALRARRLRLASMGALACGVLALPSAQAAAVDQLRSFLAQTRVASGEFTQRVTGRPGAAPQDSRGSFVFQRPGKFRWVYTRPYEQVIVADGERLYLYDRDLSQVTVKKLGGALPASPASILFGANDFERDFDVREGGVRDGLAWIVATPRQRDSPFEQIEIGFRDGLPAAMLLRDSFGQVSSLTFTGIERNPRVAAETFRFTPPPGTDVLEDF
jgi:outer membrane lipoprotein carrier protein